MNRWEAKSSCLSLERQTLASAIPVWIRIIAIKKAQAKQNPQGGSDLGG
jgi:hypothetical protein